MRCLLFGLILSLCAVAAGASPWPRETGAVFLAATGSYRFDLATGTATSEASVYAEYGLSPRITLGFDGTQAQLGGTRALIFARMSLGSADRRLKLAAGLGLGAVGATAAQDRTGVARFWVAAGRDHALGQGGWWNVTAAVEAEGAGQGPLGKLDATFGLNFGPRLQGMVQVEASGRAGDGTQVTVVPGLIWRTGTRTRLHAGIEARADRAGRQAGLRLGLWRDF